MPVILKNNASSTLATAITASDTGVVVANGSQFPAITSGDYFYVTLVSQAGQTEIVKVTARVGNSMTVVRAQDGSSAASFQVGTFVEMRVNAASVMDLMDEYDQASEISITDAGGYYTSGTVEGALQEAGGTLRTQATRDTVTALLADTVFTYTAGQLGTVATADTIRTRTEGFSYKVAASTASDQHVSTAGGVKLYVLPPYSVKAFGAVGDGVADDTTILQAAINAAVGDLHFESNKTYLVSSALTVGQSDLRIYGNGATLNGSAQPASASLSDRFALKIEGAWGGTSINVTAAVAEGAATLTVASTSALAAGDMVLVYSTTETFPEVATSSSVNKGCLHYIRTINSSTSLTLRDGTLFSYISASGARVRKIAPVENVQIENLNVVMGGLNKAHCGILVDYAVNVVLVNCTTDQTEDTGLLVRYAFGGRSEGGSFTNCNSPADGSSGVTGVTGYGFCASAATRDFEVRNAYFTGCRHAVAGGSFYPAAHVLIKDCHVAGGRAPSLAPTYQLDCHEDCIYWVFDGNHVNGDNATTGCSGILIRGQKAKVVNNTITNAHQNGIRVENFDSPSVVSDVIIRGNTITRPRLGGISVIGSATAPVYDVSITGNKVHAPGDDAISLSGTVRAVIENNQIANILNANDSAIRLVGTALTLGSQCKDFVIAGNTCENTTFAAVRADFAEGVVIAGNEFNSSFSNVVSLTSCTEVSVTGNHLTTSSATASGVLISASTRVSVAGGVFKNTATPSSSSSGVVIIGASTDVSVTGVTAVNFRYGVLSASPADFITVAGVNARTRTVASVDVAASANTAVAGNL